MKTIKITKKINYATNTNNNSACYFRKDYSYNINRKKCLDCSFCYSKGDKRALRKNFYYYLDYEQNINTDLYKIPITISRYIDPNLNEQVFKNSSMAVKKILENNGQVIYKSGLVHDFPEIVKLTNNNSFMYQGRVCSSDNVIGRKVKELIAPNFSNPEDIISDIINKRNLYKNIQFAVIFDPLIIGLNDSDLRNIIRLCAKNKINKIIISQLISTDYFKRFLLKNTTHQIANLLEVRIGRFWTYDNEKILYNIYDIIKEGIDLGVSISFCNNRQLNNLISNHTNCCQFDNPHNTYIVKKDLKNESI